MDVSPNTAAGSGTARWRPYAAACLLVGAALILRFGMRPWDTGQPLLIIFLFPVVISTYLGGLGPGLLATALAAVITDFYFLPPTHSFAFGSPVLFAHWLFSLLAGVLISLLFADRAPRRTRLADLEMKRFAETERKVGLGYAVAVAFLGIIGIFSYLSVVRLEDNSRLVARSHAVMANIDALLGTSWEAESDMRGYLVTGEELFAAEYTRAAGRVDGLIQQLRDAVSSEPDQVARVDALEKAIRARMTRSDSMLDLRRTGGRAAIDQRLAQTSPRTGADLQARISDIGHEMKAAEFVMLNARERDASDSASLTQAVIVFGSALALLCVGLGLVAIRRDIAARARAEAELNRFFDVSVDLYVISGGDGYFKRVSRSITEMLGYGVDEVLKIPYMELIHPEDHAAAHDAIEKQVVRGERVDQFVNRFRHKDGSWRTLSWRSMPRGELMFASARDVTDDVRAEQELREAKEGLEIRVAERTRELQESTEAVKHSERRFRALVEHSSDGVVLIDPRANVLYLSPSVRNVEGYEPEELIGGPANVNLHPDDRPMMRRAFEQLLAEPTRSVPLLWRQRHKDGRWLWLEGVATNLLDDPAVRAIVTNYRDVTGRLAHEARLEEQLKRLALLSRITQAIGERQDLRSIFSVVAAHLEEELPVDFCCAFLIEPGEERLTVSCVGPRSEALATQLGMAAGATVPIDENGLARCLRGQFVYEPDIAAVPFPFPQRLSGAGMGALVIAPLLVESQVFGVLVCARRAANSFSSGDCEFLRQATEHTAVASHQVRLYGALQQAYDDLRETQQQFMQQERLRALGQMASGIAHDINNAISPVALYTEQLLDYEPNLSTRARSHLEIIQRAVEDVAQTVARMGEFYRTREPQAALVPVDLNRLVKQVVDLTRARWSDMSQQRGVSIEMKLSLASDLPPIGAVAGQVRDALVNLVFNAVDAMPNGGPVSITTHADPAGRTVYLEVRDSGIGMDEETRRRCLEPFFTTKGERGSGLGLPMVYGVAQRHGATLEIESEPGRGTLMRLGFKVAAEQQAATSSTSGSHKPPAGPMRVLVVDDDPLLLKSLRDALESEGHAVTTANGGEAGIQAFVEAHSRDEPYPVVITDLGMPRVDGRKVATTIKASVPSTLVIMLTGWGRRLVSEDEHPAGVDQILSKPPKIAELRSVLAQHLAKK